MFNWLIYNIDEKIILSIKTMGLKYITKGIEIPEQWAEENGYIWQRIFKSKPKQIYRVI